jgi:hypothetical protein
MLFKINWLLPRLLLLRRRFDVALLAEEKLEWTMPLPFPPLLGMSLLRGGRNLSRRSLACSWFSLRVFKGGL